MPTSRAPRRARGVATPVLLAVVLTAAGQVAAQDEELQSLIPLLERGVGVREAEARSLQVYRVPLAYTIREAEAEAKRLGVRLTFPVSLGANELAASTDVGDLFERFESLTVVPGVELQIPLGPTWRLKPFGEVGVTTASSAVGTELTYGLGLRTRGERELGRARMTLGGAARYASPRSSRVQLADYTTFELGGDLQIPLGFEVGSRPASGGVYGVVRVFPDLEGPAEAVFDVGRLYEVGVSFSTSPALKLWVVELPWIALGYRFGGPFTGIRISLSFPF